MKKIKMYSTVYCPACKSAKQFLKDNNIEFESFVIDENITIDEFYKATNGSTSVPIIFIDDVMLSGFNVPKIRELLEI